MDKVEIQTRDGRCPSYAFAPAGSDPCPGVLVFMDGIGIRPAMLEIGERLAAMDTSRCFPISTTGPAHTSRWLRAPSSATPQKREMRHWKTLLALLDSTLKS